MEVAVAAARGFKDYPADLVEAVASDRPEEV
jgi:hypothetical protein